MRFIANIKHKGPYILLYMSFSDEKNFIVNISCLCWIVLNNGKYETFSCLSFDWNSLSK